MKRTDGATWKGYKQVLEAYAASQDLTLTVEPEKTDNSTEVETAKAIGKGIHRQEPEILRLLERAKISPTYFRHHLRQIGKWKATRRRLLAEGANFQLLEKLAENPDGSDGWEGLKLSGTRSTQEKQLMDFRLTFQVVQSSGIFGLNLPNHDPALQNIRYNSQQKIWIYPAKGRDSSTETLHDLVARSLILYCVREQGAMVADFMCGTGVIPQMAKSLGFKAWASDKFPQSVEGLEVAQHDIYQQELRDREEYDTSEFPDAALVVLHPPTPTWFRSNIEKFDVPDYLDWLERVIENSWPLVASNGYLALIVVLNESIADVAGITERLLNIEDVKNEAVGGKLEGHRIAASKDGREGWHILTVKKQDLAHQADVETAQANNEVEPPKRKKKLSPPQRPSSPHPQDG